MTELEPKWSSPDRIVGEAKDVGLLASEAIERPVGEAIAQRRLTRT